MSIKNTMTERNLQKALEGESIARNKYTYFAAIARKEGLEETAVLFERMAVNESAHGKLWYQMLHSFGDTAKNLENSFTGEHFEWRSMYPEFAKTAREEGFPNIGDMFDRVAAIEKNHELAFLAEYAKVLSKDSAPVPVEKKIVKKTVQLCGFCGYHVPMDEKAPVVCPVCGAIGAFQKQEAMVEVDA